MKVLPPTTQPADQPIPRRHEPASAAFREYRPCLRWEFGFTCAFCLLHESDLVEGGCEGTGLMSIEHRHPRSEAPEAADDYANCFYACRFCNSARGTAPIVADDGRVLLDPCQVAWGSRFRADGDRLVPAAGDPDAAYTHDAYRLNAARKVAARRRRTRAIQAAHQVLEQAPDRLARLEKLVTWLARDDRRTVLGAVVELRGELRRAREQLARFAAVPFDAAECRCGADAFGLPSYLDRQALLVPDVAGVRLALR